MIVLGLLVLNAAWTLAFVEYDMDQAEILFEDFIRNFKRLYRDDGEKQMRFEIFKERLQEINDCNKLHGNKVLGINKFADISKQEFENKYLGYVPYKGEGSICKKLRVSDDMLRQDVPESFDWRDKGVVTNVKFQSLCGACWAFSTIGNVESQYARKHGADKLINLSEQQLVDCDKTNNGCNGGVMSAAILNLMKFGVMTDAEYPYTAYQSKCKYKEDRVKVNVTGCVNFTHSSEEEIKAILVNHGPLTIALAGHPLALYEEGVFTHCNAEAKINHGLLLVGYGTALAGHPLALYEEGVFTHCNAEAKINHGLLLVGYGTDNKTKQPYWIIKNSWDDGWGESGYLRLIRGNPNCKVGNEELVTSEVS